MKTIILITPNFIKRKLIRNFRKLKEKQFLCLISFEYIAKLFAGLSSHLYKHTESCTCVHVYVFVLVFFIKQCVKSDKKTFCI